MKQNKAERKNFLSFPSLKQQQRPYGIIMKDIKTPESPQNNNLIRAPTCAKNAFVLALIAFYLK